MQQVWGMFDRSNTSGTSKMLFCLDVIFMNNFNNYIEYFNANCKISPHLNTLWTGDADLRLYITTVQDG